MAGVQKLVEGGGMGHSGDMVGFASYSLGMTAVIQGLVEEVGVGHLGRVVVEMS